LSIFPPPQIDGPVVAILDLTDALADPLPSTLPRTTRFSESEADEKSDQRVPHPDHTPHQPRLRFAFSFCASMPVMSTIVGFLCST
jgi:hypothetical protein